MSVTIDDLDGWVELLKKRGKLDEAQIKALCDKVRVCACRCGWSVADPAGAAVARVLLIRVKRFCPVSQMWWRWRAQ